jgi:hypothetical protein
MTLEYGVLIYSGFGELRIAQSSSSGLTEVPAQSFNVVLGLGRGTIQDLLQQQFSPSHSVLFQKNRIKSSLLSQIQIARQQSISNQYIRIFLNRHQIVVPNILHRRSHVTLPSESSFCTPNSFKQHSKGLVLGLLGSRLESPSAPLESTGARACCDPAKVILRSSRSPQRRKSCSLRALNASESFLKLPDLISVLSRKESTEYSSLDSVHIQ